MAANESPSIFWVGCADSRVPSNEIVGSEPGEIFTHRNIANVVMQTDQNLQSGLQYAVDALEVDHIVVCGHTNCGGIAASLTPTAFSPPLEGWLHHLANVYRLHKGELDSITDKKAQLRRLVELNVLEQCNNIAASALVQQKQRASLEAGAPYAVPRIHGMVYDLEDGRLINLNWQPQISDRYGKYQTAPDYDNRSGEASSKKLFNRKPPGLESGSEPGKKSLLRSFFGGSESA
jgi:carbonic anhydrase